MPTKHLVSKPSLAHLKGQAADLLKGHADHSPVAAQRLREFHPRLHSLSDAEIFAIGLKQADAYLVIAREHGFASWPRLKAMIDSGASGTLRRPLLEQIDDAAFRAAVEMMDAGDVDGLRKAIMERPSLAVQRVRFEGLNYFRNPCLLDFIAENPIRNGVLPANSRQVAETIVKSFSPFPIEQLQSAAELVASGRIARESGVQLPLLKLLCKYGARPDGALLAAVLHGEFEAAEALLEIGAPVTLVAACALGRKKAFDQLYEDATVDELHLALAIAAGFGNVEALSHLLENGEDPNRYNPLTFHSHSTPLHQAAWGGHSEAVNRLIGSGADPTIRDTIWNGTAGDWARHAGNAEISAYLASLASGRSAI